MKIKYEGKVTYLGLVTFGQNCYITFQIAFYLRQTISFLQRDEAPFVTKLVIWLFVHSAEINKKPANQQIRLNEIFIINLKQAEWIK